MRITGGKAKSIPLKIPAEDVRPSMDAVRETVFAMLGSVEGVAALDFFAGTGAYGLEALSRGAQFAHFVEQASATLAVLKINIQQVCKSAGLDPQTCTCVTRANAFQSFSLLKEHAYTWIFLDPPFGMLFPKVLPRFLDFWQKVPGFLSTGAQARLIFQYPGGMEPLEHPNLKLLKQAGKPRGNKPNIRIYANIK